ncbi:MAG: hypothetical protein QGG40_03640 [Myxococcota bacterium]|nr:hypothetical protein [Myxococcota bacterium]
MRSEGIDVGIMGRACGQPDVGWDGYLLYYQRVAQSDDAPLYLVGSVWEISTTTVSSDCSDCAFAFETDVQTEPALVGDSSWNTVEFTMAGIGIGSLDDALPYICFNQEEYGFTSLPDVLDDFTLAGELDDSGTFFEYDFDQYALYY